jgi:hypothetical protein
MTPIFKYARSKYKNYKPKDKEARLNTKKYIWREVNSKPGKTNFIVLINIKQKI